MEITHWLESNWFIISLFLSFGGFLIKITRSFDKALEQNKDVIESIDQKIDKKIDEVKDELTQTKQEVNNINQKLELQEEKRLEANRRTRIIMTGVEATLISLHNDGHNGPVTASLKEIEEYKREMSVQ